MLLFILWSIPIEEEIETQEELKSSTTVGDVNSPKISIISICCLDS